MPDENAVPRHVHLVGSVPLPDARTVFETVSAALGPRLKRIPDGETGERSDWITWLEPVFANSPALEKSRRTSDVSRGATSSRVAAPVSASPSRSAITSTCARTTRGAERARRCISV